MNPEMQRPLTTPYEQGPMPERSAEFSPDQQRNNPETLPTVETAPAQQEKIQTPTQSIPVVVDPTAVQTPVSDNKTANNLVEHELPSIASDDELIEREWVDQAKKIINITKGNPYEQAKAIAQLQADYIKKRYNRQLGGEKTN